MIASRYYLDRVTVDSLEPDGRRSVCEMIFMLVGRYRFFQTEKTRNSRMSDPEEDTLSYLVIREDRQGAASL